MSSESQLVDRFRQVQQHVAEACERVGRDLEEVTIVGASKSQPVERLAWAWDAGLRVFGENRVQEALSKSPQLSSEIDWHLIGPLQSNKAKKAAGFFSTVHSIDRIKIARALDREAVHEGRPMRGFIEVNLASEPTKHGFDPKGLTTQLEAFQELQALEIVGLMAIPPFESAEDESRRWFRKLRHLRDELLEKPEWRECPGYLSMGMSHDYALAIEEGATHVRIGTALFGPRDTG